MSRTDWTSDDVMKNILSALMNENRLAVVVSLVTALRIDDVLSIKTNQLAERMTITESKTMKKRTVRISASLCDELHSIAGKIYVFEHRTDPRRHRTRQAVYKDIKRACKLFRVSKRLNISCHSARKIYAVKEYKRTANIKNVQKLLNHSSEAVTMIYALADELTARKIKDSTPRRQA